MVGTPNSAVASTDAHRQPDDPSPHAIVSRPPPAGLREPWAWADRAACLWIGVTNRPPTSCRRSAADRAKRVVSEQQELGKPGTGRLNARPGPHSFAVVRIVKSGDGELLRYAPTTAPGPARVVSTSVGPVTGWDDAQALADVPSLADLRPPHRAHARSRGAA
jgi:hypothetical protein